MAVVTITLGTIVPVAETVGTIHSQYEVLDEYIDKVVQYVYDAVQVCVKDGEREKLQDEFDALVNTALANAVKTVVSPPMSENEG